MKMKLLSLLILVFTVLNGQDFYMIVNKNDSLSESYKIEKIDNLTFTDFVSHDLLIRQTDGTEVYFDLSKIEKLTFSEVTGIEDYEEILGKIGISLLKNYPNPFNPETMITFKTQNSGFTTVSVYNQAGQKVADLYSGSLNAGDHKVKWNAFESKATSGVYFVRVRQENKILSSKMILVK